MQFLIDIMKILFVCGCMEPGKDGVGDYTRLLSAQLIRKNHEVAVIALKDYFTNSSEESEQVVEGEKVSVLRIEKSHFQLSAIAQEYIQRFDPEWISLQYVPYSFHKKGLPLQLPGLIRKLLDGRKCHLMLHELWLGISEKSPLRQKAIGYIQ